MKGEETVLAQSSGKCARPDECGAWRVLGASGDWEGCPAMCVRVAGLARQLVRLRPVSPVVFQVLENERDARRLVCDGLSRQLASSHRPVDTAAAYSADIERAAAADAFQADAASVARRPLCRH